MNRLLLIPCLLLLGCSQSNPLRMAPYAEADYVPYSGRGSGSISGQAFARSTGGDVKYAAGSDILLMPVTPYTEEHWTRAVVGGQQLVAMESGVVAVTRTTRGDGEGRFEFRDLPAGEYYIYTSVAWADEWRPHGDTPGGRTDYLVKLGQKVTVAEDQELKLILPAIPKPPSTARPRTRLGSD